MTAEAVALDTERHQAGLLPTLPGKTRGIVGLTKDHNGRRLWTLQCENCYALETPAILVLMRSKFHSLGNDRRRLCEECRRTLFADCGCFQCKEERRGA